MSALRPAFFILYLEFFISRLNEILRHDLTLSVGEPDNAAAKQGQELRSVGTVTMSRGFAFSHVLLCKIFNVHCGSTSEIFSVARKGRKQVSTCGHKFSMLEKLLSTWSSTCRSETPPFATQPRSCWGVPSPNPALASHRWCECGVSHYIALSIPERAFIIFTGGRIWLK